MKQYYVDIHEYPATPSVDPGWIRISKPFDTWDEAEEWRKRLDVESRIDERLGQTSRS